MRTVFYSWQLSTPARVNRNLIRSALDEVVEKLDLRLEVDEATRNVPGSQSIVDSILRKIKGCWAFVPDLTLLPLKDGSRSTCNPNVLVEYGYALARPGEERIVPVMNRAFGEADKLPFDLRHKDVKVLFRLEESASEGSIDQVRAALVDDLLGEFRLLLDPRSLYGLSDEEYTVAKSVLETDVLGRGSGTYSMEDLAKSTGYSAQVVKNAVANLRSRGYLRPLEVAGTDAPPVKVEPRLYWDFDLYVAGNEPQVDARRLAEELVQSSESGSGHLNVGSFIESKGWTARRVNPALLYLLEYDLVSSSKAINRSLVTTYLRETGATRAFLRGET